MRRSFILLYKTPKNMGVAPRYDLWNEKYEPWEHMKRMGRLVGTGFYIPPEWYNHFRMFPPVNHNFQQEKTLNPQNHSEATNDPLLSSSLTPERVAVRDELARKSRLLASEGMRYYNIFWVQKPLDRMEQHYLEMRRKGVQHSVAIKKVLEKFYDEITAKKRVAAIQAEEAKLSGKFISMREAVVVMNILAQLQKEQFSPHQASLLANVQRERSHNEKAFYATMEEQVPSSSGSRNSSSPSGSSSAAVSPDALADMLSDDGGSARAESGSGMRITVHASNAESIQGLQDAATDYTGSPDWYTGASPMLSLMEDDDENSPLIK